MDVNCEGCAGCCLDWRPLAEEPLDGGRRGPDEPLDDVDSLVPLTREEVREYLDAGLADALVPRLWAAEDDGVTVGGVEVATIQGRPAFLVGLRTVEKPVGPFGHEPTWLATCVFLDPETLQCRIHGEERYPETCSTYPGSNLLLSVETECERVEREHGGNRLLEETPPEDAEPLFGPAALGTRVFAHPEPERIEGAIERFAANEATQADRAEFLAVAAASSPGTIEIEPSYYERRREQALTADSWVGRSIEEWQARANGDCPDPSLARSIEAARGAPETPGWDAIDE